MKRVFFRQFSTVLPRMFAFFALVLVLYVTLPKAQAVGVFYVTPQGGLEAIERSDANDAISALAALASPPTEPQPLLSAIPAGTRILGLNAAAEEILVEFSTEVLSVGMDELRLETIFRQVKATLAQFGFDSSIRLTAGGKTLSEYLPPKPVVVQQLRPSAQAASQPDGPQPAGKLGSKMISLSPGHGRFWTGSGWNTQRPVYCSPLSQEDYHNLETMKYLETYLVQEGAIIKTYRCTDLSYGNHSSGQPWWRMASPYWLQHLGYPCSIYASYTHDCTLGTGGNESNDDVRARPLASDADGADIYISLHSNGNTGDCTGAGCPTGSETFYDAGTEHAAYGAVSQTLGNNVHTAMMDAIKANVDSTWKCHGTCVKNSNGAYGEIRIPDRAAILTELAYHDTCDRDALHLRDNFFRSAAMWGMYKGVCTYFGITPTWAFYSDELVSHNIPATMVAGSSVTVQITFRNRGVLWNDARSFRLGAVDDSDPFSTTTRFALGADVGPSQTKTFSITLRAPATPGVYTTDWRMLRENVSWFGATATQTITVTSSDAAAVTSGPASQTVNPGTNVSFTVTTSGIQPLYYQWRRGGNDLSDGGKFWGVTTSTLTISNVQQSEVGAYSVVVSNSAGHMASPEALLAVTAVLFFEDNFESGNLSAWTTQPGASALGISTAQQRTPGGMYSAYLDSSLDKMQRDLGAELIGHSRASWWIYDSGQARAYGEIRGYTGSGSSSGSLTQLIAAGKYSSVTMAGEVYDATKYQGRVVYGSNTGWFNLNAPGSPVRQTGWHKFEIERMADGTTVNFYVDGALSRQVTGVLDIPWDNVAVGSVAAGSTAGDAWFDDIRVEYFDPPVVQTGPLAKTANAGEAVTFDVSATGNVLTYQWRKDGTNVTNGGAITGATTATLGISSAQQAHAGSYDVAVRNGAGTVTTVPVDLEVLPPPPIMATVQVSGENVTITWSATPTWTYRVQFKTNLTDSIWTALTGDVTATEPVASKVDIRSTAGRFYRVLLVD
jgi:N-acetylmuramoyl-L-alanine amidase